MFCKDSVPQRRGTVQSTLVSGVVHGLPFLTQTDPELSPGRKPSPSPAPRAQASPQPGARCTGQGRSTQTVRGQPFPVSGVQFPVSARRVLSLWNSQLDTSIIKILSHLPHEGTVRHSSAFDDTNSYFDFTHIFALKTISCDISNESSDFSHFNWTHRFYLTIWNGLLEFKTNYDTRNACHHNYINVIWEARLPFAGNREKKKKRWQLD